jgi:hypothetical protein
MRRRTAWWIGITGASLAYFLGLFAPAVDAAYIHLVRAPVPATISSCFDGSDILPCSANWTIDGEEHFGWVRSSPTSSGPG